ncbi:MAG TPA: hypothetical protein VF105_14085 [Gemmatimonadaceae bacterium]
MPKTDSFFNPEQYATVAERIELFYSRYPQGRINTELVSRADGEITFKAVVFRDAAETDPAATGWASERVGDSDINTVACLENTETSAVGRALANLGFIASGRRPSREEMEKTLRARTALAFGRRRESPPSLQTRANARDDVLQLLAVAEQKGFSSLRAEIIRGRVGGYPGLVLPRIRKIESALRHWVRRHEL